MPDNAPRPELDRRFSSEDATATPWAAAREILEKAEIYWLSTVRPDGRPHVTPLLAVWLDDALYFCTGRDERKAKNLGRNAHCAITTGANALGEGMDVVVEGDAAGIRDEPTLQRLANEYLVKYGEDWRFTARDGVLVGAGGEAVVYRLTPKRAFGFGRGTFSQTRWTF
jgi:nitroimidazol reductase NimA-like FMN-containing flavoprotein (pyridoxamine 5'-phosphate oxidase superfamily)